MLDRLHEVQGQRRLWVGVRNVDVHLELLALVERAPRSFNHHGYLLDELEIVGVDLVDAVEDPRLELDVQDPEASRAPAGIAALAVALAWFADLLRVIFLDGC